MPREGIALRKSHTALQGYRNVTEMFSNEVQAVAVTLDAFAISDAFLFFSPLEGSS